MKILGFSWSIAQDGQQIFCLDECELGNQLHPPFHFVDVWQYAPGERKNVIDQLSLFM